MHNILITSGGRRVSLVKAFQKELRHKFPKAKVIVVDAEPILAPAAQIADMFLSVSRIEADNYIQQLLGICMDNSIKLIIPTLDTELPLFSKNIQLFRDNGIDIVISNEELIELSKNKLKTHSFFEKSGVSVAKHFSKLDYKLPLYIKPIDGSSSKNNFIVKTENHFSKLHFEKEKLLFFEYLDHDFYDEFTCDLYYDRTGILKCAIPRKRIEVRSGEISKGVTCKNRIYDLIISKFNKIKGAKGCVTIQFFLHKTSDEIRGIEINPRFGGGYPLSYFAGGNYPKWIIEEYIENREISFFDAWENNLLMLRYDHEILIHGYSS